MEAAYSCVQRQQHLRYTALRRWSSCPRGRSSQTRRTPDASASGVGGAMPPASGIRRSDWKIHICWRPFICAEHSNCHLRPGAGRSRARTRGQGATNMAWQSAARHCILFLSNRSSEFDCSTNLVHNVATEMVAMSSSVEKLVDAITGDKAGFLPASILPCWRFCFAFIALSSSSKLLSAGLRQLLTRK